VVFYFRTGLANPNWSLGRNLPNSPKISTFGPQNYKKLGKYTQNIEKSTILDSSLGRGLATPVLEKLASVFFLIGMNVNDI
jgi:hypothetical protein